MRLFNLFPWRYVIRRIAHRQGFLDPIELLARLRRFSQPSEVQEPIELIRAGMIFHARGLVNTKVIQNNLDWVWPYWIVRQFSPDDTSFIPRAFSFSHVNLTHRNWTALGVPGCLELPIVDPRGMVTPHHDDWSVDHWFLADEGKDVFPSWMVQAGQRLKLENGHLIETTCGNESAEITLESEVTWEGDQPVLRTRARINAHVAGKFAVAVRPCNPEGVQFIEQLSFSNEGKTLDVDGLNLVQFDTPPHSIHTSDYRHGDVLRHIRNGTMSSKSKCEAGLATAAVAYELKAGQEETFTYGIPILADPKESDLRHRPPRPEPATWDDYLDSWTRVQLPDTRMQGIFESSKRTLALLSQSDILPGPYTYRRFWFRDACLIGNALLGLGQAALVAKSLKVFPSRQRFDGYFHSQEGEWDSNGQVLWLADRYERLNPEEPLGLNSDSIMKGARWIDRKRRKTLKEEGRHKGLLPAGFSAEHLGPNDYYYWDDFWGAAGLRAAESMFARRDLEKEARDAGKMAESFERDILDNLEALDPGRVGNAIPASPYRRMDSGAIGSMVADYPLRLSWVPEDRLKATVDWLIEKSLHRGGFFQDMIHSGINAYLSLDLAQSLLHYGDSRYWNFVCRTAEVASPTGKWPEAVHPQTGGGCMGDGEHAWAAAEWCQMIRSLFIMETGRGLDLGKGLPDEWLEQEDSLFYGPTLTSWGRLSLSLEKKNGKWHLQVDGDWTDEQPDLKVCLPDKFDSELSFS